MNNWRLIAKKPYFFYFLISVLAYAGIDVWVNQGYVTFPAVLSYQWSISIPFLLFHLLIPLLVGLNVVLMILKIKELKAITGSMSAMGAFGGVLGGACPGCFAGLFPGAMGLFGISATLGDLPFNGIEIQVASALLLTLSAVLLSKETACKVKK